EAQLAFTRPRGWKVNGVKAVIRFQHSPALIASRSNLTLRVNDRSVGSVPLNRKESQVGQVVFNIPPNLIQDYNDLSIVAQQQNTPECSDPGDATLWTEILPDSKLIFDFQGQPIPLNFSRYPYPFFDDLNIDTNRIVYLLPKVNDAWLTSAPRFQAALGRMADFRSIETRLVKDLDEVESNERLVIIGTPGDQPALKSLDLPFGIAQNQLLDGNKVALPEDVGVLILTTTNDGSVPVLVATGNGTQGVTKAAQFLVQPDTRKLGTGQAILVSDLKEEPTPSLREWPRFLPAKNSFKLSELKVQKDGTPFKDITVRGAGSPPIDIDFRALPDDHFKRGSSMTMRYSYGPQVNPRTSAVEVLLDGVFIGGARLDSEQGATRKSLKVDLPANLIKPSSQLQVAFRLNPREPGQCGRVTDQQLTGTLHADTSFDLNRETSVDLPNLELLQVGFPFAAPQDLSGTAVVLPDSPSTTDLLTLLTVSERLGRLSQSKSIKLNVYTANTVTPDIRKKNHLVGIGIREKFPFPEVFESGNFRLSDAFSRLSSQASIQTLPDTEGMIKEIMSPDNGDRVLLALTAQTEEGLDRVRQIISKDPWFFQLQKDTVLVSSNQQDASSYDPDAYKLEFLDRAPSTKRLENTTLLSKVSRFLQENWVFLPAGIVTIALLLYGISQLYLKRLTDKKSH
ncbi:MAG TPA: cellulose biosynthesis cyclic di-GMP-binding regulatory protein BcsB, partial [Coleofasciculaceae cyanobacterium]